MRIVHTALRYPPATGGAETYIQALVEKTRTTIQADVRVITSSMRTHGPISMLPAEALLNDPAYIQRLGVNKTPFISYPRLNALTHYIGHHKPDILHGYSFWYQPADVAARYAKRHRIPFFFHPIYYEHGTRTKPIWQLYKKTIGQQTFAAADVVIVISPFEQQLIEQAGLPVKRFALIPPGIDVDTFATPQPNPFLKRAIHGHILLMVNRLSADKRLDDAIVALSRLPHMDQDVHLVLVGEDFGAQSGLKEKAKGLGLEKRVHFLGKLPDNELHAAYQHATLFIHTSGYEAFGIVLAEALAAGKPVIARNTAAIPYVVPHNHSGLLFTTTEELTTHIAQLLKDPAQAEHLATKGQARITTEFTWDESIKKLINLYQEYGQ